MLQYPTEIPSREDTIPNTLIVLERIISFLHLFLVRHFKGEGHGDSGLAEHRGPAGVLLALADGEEALLVAEDGVLLLDQLREGPGLQVVGVGAQVVGAVAEQVGLGRVAVEVEVVHQPVAVLLLETLGQPVQVVRLRKDVPAEPVELAVEVFAAVAGPEVARDHAVGVHHRDDLEDVPPQEGPALRVLQQPLHEALHHERGHRLSRVDPPADQHHLLLVVVVLVGDRQQRQRQAAQRLAQRGGRHQLPELGCDALDVALEPAVGVGDPVGDGDGLAGVLEVHLEFQLVVLGGVAEAAVLLRVGDVALGLPPGRTLPPGEGPHALAVQIGLLDQVADVEPDAAGTAPVGDREVEPVAVSLGVGVAPDEAVVLAWPGLDHEVQVPALEVGVEEVVCVPDSGPVPDLPSAHAFHCLPQQPEVELVPAPVLPGVLVLLVHLDAVDWPAPQVNQGVAMVLLECSKNVF